MEVLRRPGEPESPVVELGAERARRTPLSAPGQEPSMNDYLSDVFGGRGLFASRFPGYEMREGQVALARMVDEAMRGGRHALGEGPCGTGKGVAYGVPAVWHAHHGKKRVVIATANIALQEQLIRKDLPLLAEVLPWPFTFALLKGRNNYLCLDRLRESEARGELSGLYDDDQDRQADAVLEWARRTQTGDVSELPFIPLPQVWSKASVGSDECKGDDCPFRDDCFAERAKAAAREADIVVTNYHMLFAHIAVRRETGQDLVLPPFDLLVCDEAHEAAEIARDFFGFTVSEHAINRLARTAADLGDRALADRLRQRSGEIFDRVAAFARSPAYRCRLQRPGFVATGALARELEALATLGDAVEADDRRERAVRATGRNAARLARAAAARIEEAAAQSDPGKVYWIDLDGRDRARLKAKPIDVSDLLREELFGATESVTLVSATLTAGGTFDFIRGELGVPEGAVELVAESPFDFRSQALLVVPDDGLPDPRDFGFPEAAADFVGRVMDFCDGRTLGLFTSYRVLNAVYDRVRGNGHRVLRQGDMPRTELTRIFKEDIRSVLLGTESFWTGIDVPGEALTGLVIDKLPFPHPEDPVVSAICERDPQAFNNYLVPKAIIALRQGVGRLIRSRGDVGVVVLLDRRVAEKRYGRRFLRSLPPMLTTRRIENIPRFLEEAAHARAS
jgi:ATP-dependent DNA helicase DinG